ncbi:MAG: cobalt-precorrin-6A reductase [Rhizobiaceae bacterium]
MTRILILGGTREAAELAAELVAEVHDVTTSLAGRTKEPALVAGNVRIGGFGGAQGLAQWLTENGIERLIDATHPFAKQISRNATEAAVATGVEFERLERPPWQKHTDDKWHEVITLEHAAAAVPAGARALLALGGQHLSAFATRADVHFVIRMIDPPETPLPFVQHDLILDRPSQDWREEAKLLEAKLITHIVARNSGGDGAYAKIEAARKLGVPVIMIERPKP